MGGDCTLKKCINTHTIRQPHILQEIVDNRQS